MNGVVAPRAPRCPVCTSAGASAFERFEPFRLLRCPECDLVFAEPMRAMSGEEYAQQYADGGHHDDFVTQLGIGHRRFLRSHRRQGRRGATLLDIGCSTGLFVEAARRAGFLAAGVEHDAAAVRAGRELFPQIDVTQGELASFVAARPDARFDFVTMFEVVEHVADPRGLVAQATTLLRPGGTLVVFVPNRNRTPRLYAEMVERGADVPPHHLTKWSRRAATRLLHVCGLEDVHTRAIGKYRFPWLPALGLATRVRGWVIRKPAQEAGDTRAPAERVARRYDGRAASAYALVADLRAGIDGALFWPADAYYRLSGYERDGLYAEGRRARRVNGDDV